MITDDEVAYREQLIVDAMEFNPHSAEEVELFEQYSHRIYSDRKIDTILKQLNWLAEDLRRLKFSDH